LALSSRLQNVACCVARVRHKDLSMLTQVANVFVALMALLHVYILVLEMFLWTTPRGRKAFGLTKEFAEASKTLAANQGLYNGFLAAGLVWGLCLGPTGTGAKLFFLGCILVAGLYGGMTVGRKIVFIQAIPAAIGIALVLAAAHG
jgi:putative membrane protein